MPDIAIFAPSPILTVTVESGADGEAIHIHAGGQGVWQARMLRTLGADVTLCCVLSGEIGRIVRHLLDDEGLRLAAVTRDGRGSAYIHDRRSGSRQIVAEEEGEPLGRHDLDQLYSIALREGMDAGNLLMSGPAGDAVLPPDTYRRLAADVRSAGGRVIADLSGDRLGNALAGGVDVLKVNREELIDTTGRHEDDPETLLASMATLRERGADTVIVSRGDGSVLLLDREGALEAEPPHLEATDPRGTGDSLTAGIAAALLSGESAREGLSLGVAAGAVNVTRHGLGTGDADTIRRLRSQVRVRPLADHAADEEQTPPAHTSPDGLAAAAASGAGDPGAAAEAEARAESAARSQRRSADDGGEGRAEEAS